MRFQVDQEAVLLDGAPALAVIDLGAEADVARIQGVLDRLAPPLRRTGRRKLGVPTPRALIIRGEPGAIQELRNRFEVGCQGGWNRRVEIEDRLRPTLPAHTLAFCYSKLVPALDREVAVLVRSRGPGTGEELRLSGIVPLTGRGTGPLNPDQHDQVVSDFRDTFVEPLSRDLRVRVLDLSMCVHPSLEELLSTEAAARLRAFAAAADKNALGVLDLRGWNAFIGQVHLDQAVVDPNLLETWLADEGFPPDKRDSLIREWESGLRLLSAYDDERRE